MMSQGEQIAKLLAERDNLMLRLNDSGIGIIHSRLHGTVMRVPSRNGSTWEPFTTERAKELLAEMEPPSMLDIANAKMREGWDEP